MNNSLYDKITIVLVLYEEEFILISQWLESIKHFNIIIIEKKVIVRVLKNLPKKHTILLRAN